MIGSELTKHSMRISSPQDTPSSPSAEKLVTQADNWSPDPAAASRNHAGMKKSAGKGFAIGALAILVLAAAFVAYELSQTGKTTVAEKATEPSVVIQATPSEPSSDARQSSNEEPPVKNVSSEDMAAGALTANPLPPSAPGLIEKHDVSVLDESEGGMFTKKVKPFLEQNCVQCHCPEKEKGDLRADLLVADLNDHYSLNHFQNIVDELTTPNATTWKANFLGKT